MSCQDGTAPSLDEPGHGDDVSRGTIGDVLPGSLLGPVMGLAFSTDGGLLFACSGSSISVYHIHSGALLSTVRVLMPGLAVYGLDVGRESREYRYFPYQYTSYHCVAASDGEEPTPCIRSTAVRFYYTIFVHLPCLWRLALHSERRTHRRCSSFFFHCPRPVVTLPHVCGVKQTLTLLRL